jgi:DNA-binding winged helix-turn-helix (wHTH) protein
VRVRFADYSLDTDARQLFRGTREVHLSPKAFELLKLLVEKRPKALSKQELLERVWPGVYVSDASLARAVNEIRDAIDDHSRSDGFVQTVHGFGYRFASVGVVDLDPPAGSGDAAVYRLIGANIEFRITEGEHVIGRDPSLTIRLESPRISRQHARLVVRGHDVTIEDLESTNGTFVGGRRIETKTPVASGDEIHIGPIRLRLKLADDSANTRTEIWTRDQA